MNDALRMQVSAFVDGELAENETELLLRRLSQDAALRQLVAQYLTIGRALRGEREIPGMADLRGRIAAALGEEQPSETLPATARPGFRWLRPVAGMTVAATVAGLALVSLQALRVDAPVQPAATVAGDAAATSGYTEPAPAEALSDRPASETLRQYYVRHGETSSDLGPNGILTRLVTLELRRGELVEVNPGETMTAPIDSASADPDASDGSNDDEQPERTP